MLLLRRRPRGLLLRADLPSGWPRLCSLLLHLNCLGPMLALRRGGRLARRPAGSSARLLLPCHRSYVIRRAMNLLSLELWLRPSMLQSMATAVAGSIVWRSRRRAAVATVMRWRCR